MKPVFKVSKTLLAIAAGAGFASIMMLLPQHAAHALKYAAPEHDLQVDPSIPKWVPGPVDSVPEEEIAINGADIMDELELGWAKIYREAYPRLSVTIEAKSSTSAHKALINGTGDLAPVGREMMPLEIKAFNDKFGYDPFPIKVATGSLGSLGKTATSVIFVDKDNPIKCLSVPQLDAIYSTSLKRGHAPINTWSDAGVIDAAWKDKPIHLYGLKSPNGIELFFNNKVLDWGTYRTDIEFVKGKGFTHAFNVAAEDMAKKPGGITYAMLANVEPNIKVLPISQKDGGECISPTIETVYHHTYPLSRYVYIYINRKPGTPIPAKVKEFLKMVLSKQGQDVVAKERVYMPLTPEVVKEELAKLE